MPTSQTPLASGTTNDAELIQALMRALQAFYGPWGVAYLTSSVGGSAL